MASEQTALERAEREHYTAMLRGATRQRFSEGDYLHTIGPVIEAARAEGWQDGYQRCMEDGALADERKAAAANEHPTCATCALGSQTHWTLSDGTIRRRCNRNGQYENDAHYCKKHTPRAEEDER